MQLADWIKQQGRALGFARVGIAPAHDFPELHRLAGWLEKDFAGELAYLHNPKRRDVRELLPDARSLICCALPYDTSLPRSTERPPDSERGWISRYAWGDDYHTVVEEKLEALRAALAENADPDFVAKLYVDTGPVLERVYGKYAGLGWQAKNTCLLDTELGSFFFLGVLVTNLELQTDSPLPDGCGSCTLCLEACPTGAIVQPYVLDARRCISYLTIELRGSIPTELRAPMGQHVFGCDICQDVCPYNQKAWVTDAAAFQPRQLEIRKGKLETRHSEPGPSSRSETKKQATTHEGRPLGLRPPAPCHSEPAPSKRSEGGQSEESQPYVSAPPEPLLSPAPQTPPSPEACPEPSRGAHASGSPDTSQMERESLFHPRKLETRDSHHCLASPESCHSEPAPPKRSEGGRSEESQLNASSLPLGSQHHSLFHPRLDWLASLSEAEFKQLFRGSAIKRAKWRGLIRNTLVAMGNSGNPCFRPLLERFAHSDDPVLSEHAKWALQQLPPSKQETR